MAPVNSGLQSTRFRVQKNVKSKGRKKFVTTRSTNRHRFQPFSERIAKLTVDPIRRSDTQRLRDDDDEHESYFLSSLTRWKDTNLSENFTNLAREISPLCQSLPQVLLYQQELVDLLFKYLALDDALSLEPILDLITQLARDLGARYEAYFESTVQAITRLAAKHESVEVIEWAFTCLAWLFKYLSRLLVPDLRQLYDLMAPYLGKERHKSFVSKFSAESMSFLLRKAAAQYNKDKQPLANIVYHAFEDLSTKHEAADKSQYQEGLVVLFSEAIKGVQKGTHSSAKNVVHVLLSLLSKDSSGTGIEKADILPVIEAIMIDVLHHTDATGFSPVFHEFLLNLYDLDANQIAASARLFFVILTTGKGSSIDDWSTASTGLVALIDSLNGYSQADNSAARSTVLQACAAMLQYAPISSATSFAEIMFQKTRQTKWFDDFLPFATLVAEMGRDRFTRLVLHEVQLFIATRWELFELQLCTSLKSLTRAGVLANSSISLPQEFNDKILQRLHALSQPLPPDQTKNHLALCYGYLNVLKSIDNNDETRLAAADTIFQGLIELLQNLRQNHSDRSVEDFLICNGLNFATRIMSPDVSLRLDIVQVLSAMESYGRTTVFLVSLTRLLQELSTPFDLSSEHCFSVFKILIDNLASPSFELRHASLDTLAALYSAGQKSKPTVLSLLQDIEGIPVTVENIRKISLSIRKLPMLYKDCITDECMKEAVPSYCFGLLHARLTPLWEDACNALREICDITDSENIIIEKAISWLQQDLLPDFTQAAHAYEEDDLEEPALMIFKGLQNFRDANVDRLDEMAAARWMEYRSAYKYLDQARKEESKAVSLTSSINRGQGLRVLRAVPQVAERRSRVLVPVLLDWVQGLDSTTDENGEDTIEGDDQVNRSLTHHRWSRKDQKALLALFEQFSNPAVLYRSKEVYESLKGLLCNGDAEIQKSALKALLAWKEPFLTPYRENLFNLLDDARFREELTVFLDPDDPDKIGPEHRLDLMPVLLRLLYGRVVTRTGLGGPRGTQEARRKAVLVSVAQLGQDAINEFLRIALGPFSSPGAEIEPDNAQEDGDRTHDVVSIRRAAGMLRMLKDMISTFSDQTAPLSFSIARMIVHSLIRAHQSHRSLDNQNDSGERHNSLLKTVRQEGLACLSRLYAKCHADEWTAWLEPILFRKVINPRVESIPNETTQSVSNLFRLFATWATSIDTAKLLIENSQLLPRISDCLVTVAAKSEVKRFVLRDILSPFIETAMVSDKQDDKILLSHDLAHTFLCRISEFLQSTQEKDLIEASVEVAIKIRPAVHGFRQAKSLLELVLQLLSRPPRQVSVRLKGQLLELLQQLIPDYNWEDNDALYVSCLRSLSRLFLYFNDSPNRLRLVAIFETLSANREELRKSFTICAKLNSFSSSRLNAPDYEAREEAFQALNNEIWPQLNPLQCLPIVCNLLYFIKDEDELSTRAGASLGLRKFVEAFASMASPPHTEPIGFADVIEGTILPAIQAGFKESSELIRSEYVTVFAEMVKSGYDTVIDMQPLLGPDEEAAFFNNILHIQPHRRIRALQRLSSDSVSLTSVNIGRFLVPLVESFLANADGESHNLAAAATRTLEQLAHGLDWHRYRALLHRKMQEPGSFESKPRIRVIGALISALHDSSLSRASHKDSDSDKSPKNLSTESKIATNLSKTLPEDTILHKSLSSSVLSKLMEQIHYQDESSLDVRILAATFIVKLVLVFPQDRIHEYLPSVLIDVCNILKSRAQEARDSARKTLAEIAAIIGAPYFGFLVKQLRTALKRGFQMHVLSFTTHALLVSVSGFFEAGSLDYCVPELVSVVTDDVFGITSQDKEAAGYVSSMKEVKKKSLGFDSMEILASLITLPRVAALLRPISAQLDRPRPKLEKVDELLRRIREGMRRNPNVNSRDILTLSFEMLKENVHIKDTVEDLSIRAKKMVIFTLELMRRVLDKYEHLKTAENLAGFMPLLASAGAQSDEEVRMALFRLLASIIKVPLHQLDEYAAKFIQEARNTVENAISTNELLPQAALRLTSAILRERPEAVISQARFETDIAFLLSKLKPDLQEPGRPGERERQIAAFNFLKAVMGRGIVMTEIYDVMNVVREVMLTSSEPPIPELSRGVYSRFILDYFPGQGKGLSKQLDFLTTNLQYEHSRGRLSVMEVMAFVLGRMDATDVQPVMMSFFLPLVLVMVVDENPNCRNAAGALLHKTFERADTERIKLFKGQMTKWMDPDGNNVWRQAGLKMWGIYLEEHPEASKDATTVSRNIREIIELAIDEKGTSASLQLLSEALDLYRTLVTQFPGFALAKNTTKTWKAITLHLKSESSQVRMAATELIGHYLANFARTAAQESKVFQLPLTGSHGLELTTDELLAIVSSGMTLVESEAQNSEAIDKTIKNLAFVGRVCGSLEVGQESDEPAILEELVHEIARILRADIDIARPPVGKLACLKLVSTLYKAAHASQLEETLREVLLPLQHLTDKSIAAPKSADPDFARTYEEMASLAAEVQDQIREKMGSEIFLREMAAVQQVVRDRRAERKAKRALEAVAEPEKVERDKKRKRAREKGKRRERNIAYAGKRRGW